ncbi:MAG TPA: hypothetical protein VKI45_01785 [Allosphingosinicella sp.]|nr:hypothetical protein [Allosphingosinicella sp.]
MVVLKYGKAKLFVTAAGTVAVIGLYIVLLMDPPEGYGTAAFLGHHPRLAPMLIGALLVFAWRAVALALGDSAALEATPTELILTNFCGTRRLPWRTMTQIAGKIRRTRYGDFEYLVVRSVDGETSLSLRSTDMVTGALDALIDTVDGLRCGAVRALSGARAGTAPVPLGADAATFEAEAVMARYLANKAAEASAPAASRFGTRAAEPVPAPAPVAARPAFGRKGL